MSCSAVTGLDLKFITVEIAISKFILLTDFCSTIRY